MASPFEHLRVLVVDDHDLQRQVVARRVHGLGVAEVFEANDGARAQELLSGTSTIDVVVCDLNMPNVDGIELVRWIAERGIDVTVAFMSATDPVILECAELLTRERPVRFVGAIAKPVSEGDLARLFGRRVDGPTAQFVPVPTPVEDVRAALSAGEIRPHYQPIVDAQTGATLALEALARWEAADGRILLPAQFLGPLLREDGSERLTWAIIDGVLDLLDALRQRALDVTVSVNVAADFLALPRIDRAIAAKLSERRLPTRALTFEVTESTALTTNPDCLESLARLRMRGHHLAADDFGTAYASLKQLVRVPFEQMKLDRGFLRDAMANPRAWSVLRASVAMARSLG